MILLVLISTNTHIMPGPWEVLTKFELLYPCYWIITVSTWGKCVPYCSKCELRSNTNYLHCFWNLSPGWTLTEMVALEVSSKREATISRGSSAVVVQPSGPSPFSSDPFLLQMQWPQLLAAETARQGMLLKNRGPRGPPSLTSPNSGYVSRNLHLTYPFPWFWCKPHREDWCSASSWPSVFSNPVPTMC